MKKIVNLTKIIIILSLNCEATEFFIGLEQSYKKIKNITYINGVKEHHKKSLNISSLKIGGIFGSKEGGDRYELNYALNEENIVSKLNTIDVSIHYNLTLPSIINSKNTLPYFRLGGSYSRVSEKNKNSAENPKYDAYGYIIGIGSYYILNKYLELSIGVDYNHKKWNNIKLYQNTITVKAKEDIEKAYIGINYLF